MGKEEKIELIENYLEGKLSQKEISEFDFLIKEDDEFAKEVEEYNLLKQSMNTYKHRRQLKQQLELAHKDYLNDQKAEPKGLSLTSTKKSKIRVLWQKYSPTLAVAATVALISVFTTILTLNNVRTLEKQQSSNYRSLSREIEGVNKELEAIAKKQKENTQNRPVRQYGATAFVISSNGYLVTNSHVVENADSIYIEIVKDSVLVLKAEVVYKDNVKDLAILKITDPDFIGFTPLPYSIRTQEADLGEIVYTLAYPRKDMVYGEGSISAHSGYNGDTTTYQISIPVNPGNSGGPLLDDKGNLIGIVSGKNTDMDGAAFAVKAKYIQSVVDSLSKQQSEHKLLLPRQNFMQYPKRPEQIKKLQNFVFLVKAYNSK